MPSKSSTSARTGGTRGGGEAHGCRTTRYETWMNEPDPQENLLRKTDKTQSTKSKSDKRIQAHSRHRWTSEALVVA
ncbi:hypothetical protein Cob_v013180 [Colletotrichum orbiculare MAFF 240422]|uniref:Uncharacterized protein n=1 Tax=Colletotrichum orbiculare (strain 104-T / ATCC 96160 / CBS 514.97 / LARS 414 / MAFF 240422) TaxID=1213857 RepID=A0A484F7M9_COLOR|nr:hypothetical protein Cob_v013180 [Colletotrichum orbiculare MAFF 240422]